MRTLRARVFASGLAGLLATVVLIAGCGGGGDSDVLHPEDATASPQSGAATTPQAGGRTPVPAKASPVPAKATPTPAAEIPPLLSEIKPVAIQYPAGYKAPLVGGPNVMAQDALSAILKQNGVDVDKLSVLVLPVRATGDSLLVIDVPESAAATALPKDATALGPALVNAPVIAEARIVSICFYAHGSDAQGRFVTIMVLPVKALQASLGSQSSSELGKAVKFEVRRLP